MNGDSVLLYEMFSFCKDNAKLRADFSSARVISAMVGKDKKTMKVSLSLAAPTPPSDVSNLEDIIAKEYGLESVSVTAVYARLSPLTQGSGSKASAYGKPDIVIMGKKVKNAITPMELVTLELGSVTVTGEVCNVLSKKIDRLGAWVLEFEITDYTGTINVAKYLADENAEAMVKKVEKGSWLTVSGILSISRFNGDLTLEPMNIFYAEKELRTDSAEVKRVELHLHTKMSAMDAVTDTKEAIMRAAQWGHGAIAITDHGVVHTFPDAAAAAAASGGAIKVIYGMEGYFVNDVDGNIAVFGIDEANDCQKASGGEKSRDEHIAPTRDETLKPTGSFEDEFVVFDIETTGLSATEDVVFEIGAVLIKNGQVCSRFHTYADPQRPLPIEITKLTGRQDTDLAGAPTQYEAIKAFLEFVGDRIVVAHNAMFDVGFIYESCLRLGISYKPCYIDTLALARNLMPNLKNHRLDTVAAFLGYAGFNHHRGDEDAAATAHIFAYQLTKLKEKGITSIHRINSYLIDSADHSGRRGRVRHIILLAKNQTGLRNLYKLVSKSHLDDFDRNPIIRKSVLMEFREGLIIGSACEAGEVFELVTERRSTLELRQLAMFYDYLEIQPICNNMFMLYGNKPRANNEEDLRNFNRRIIEIGKGIDKPVVATGDVHFIDPEHEVFRHILLTSKGYSDAVDDLPLYYRTTEEMLEEFSYLDEQTAYDVVVNNTVLIAEMCEVVNPLPPSDKLFLPKIENSAEDLRTLVYDTTRKLYGNNPPQIIAKRIETELHDILERGYDVIYMTAQMLVADAMKHKYLVGSRGSVGSSFVAYLAGITEVNALPAHYRCPNCCNSDFDSGHGWGCGADMPDKICPECGTEYIKEGFNIPFETFLGFDGVKVPDIDLNFSGEYQTQAHKFTIDLFGADNVFRAGTIGTVKEKTAYGHVKKYLEVIGKTVTKAEENRLVQGCVGVKRATGQHPGGLVVIPQGMEITDFCPVQHPADSSDKGIITTHFEYHSMEDNLIKLDALGHDNPTMLRMLEVLTGVDSRGIRLDDTMTMALFKSPTVMGLPDNDDIIGPTGTIGIPEFGTGFTRQMLSETHPETFDTLVRLSGFSHGVGVWVGNAKDLILSGKVAIEDTIGCRDDIMNFLISMDMDDRYAFKISESVRKGRGLPEGAQEDMIDHGIPGWYIESCKKMTYLFPKAHAVAYVIEAFRIAWFKVHKPLEFYSTLFYRRSQKNNFDVETMTQGIDRVRAKIRETRNNLDPRQKDEDSLPTLEACYEFYMRGFDFDMIDIYESDAVKFLISGENKLRPPFVAISGLGETGARDLATMRAERKFISIDEISAACPKVSKTHIEQLKALGALRDLPDSSQMSLFN